MEVLIAFETPLKQASRKLEEEDHHAHQNRHRQRE
jgi:hypothetical protein